MFVGLWTYVHVGWEHMFVGPRTYVAFLGLSSSWISRVFVFTLTYSHHRPQTPICRAFEGREGWAMSLTLPSHFGSHSLPSHSGREVSKRKKWGRREGERKSLTCLQAFVHRPLRWVMWVCEGHFRQSIKIRKCQLTIVSSKVRIQSIAFWLGVRRERIGSP